MSKCKQEAGPVLIEKAVMKIVANKTNTGIITGPPRFGVGKLGGPEFRGPRRLPMTVAFSYSGLSLSHPLRLS